VFEVEWTDNRWEKKIELSIGRKLRKGFTKQNSGCQTSVSVKFNGDLKFAGSFKVRGFDIFAISE
jgi:hypothetical protein